jgi:putative MATE family efflux protein
MTEKKAGAKKLGWLYDRKFYRHTLYIAVPIMIQNGITNFVSMLDNIMVGQIGTTQMSGVSIVNQLLFVFNLMIFGGLAGIGIYTAQYAGKGDQEGIRITFRMKLILAAVLVAVGLIVFLTSGVRLASLWLSGGASKADLAETLTAAHHYLLVMCIGLLPFALSQVCADTLRELGETMTPMKAGLLAVAVNLIGNYILIYGKFGAPALGVVGAAIATVISRLAEASYLVIWLLRHTERFPFVHGVFSHFHIPLGLAKTISFRAFPLLLNETLWSLGQTVLSQQYSLRGLTAVAAFNISNTIANVFNIAFIAMGSATAIILGQELGSGKTDTVKRDAHRLAFISVVLCLFSGALLFAISGLFPRIYNTSDEIRAVAAGLIRVSACFMPVYAYENAAYFTLRSGGKTWITFFFDSCFVWVASLPLAAILTHFTSLPIIPLFALVQTADFIKMFIGFFMVRSGRWIHDLTEESQT